jgi:enamine deaminase RidA (YjgF/YER057c/UK114 family)
MAGNIDRAMKDLGIELPVAAAPVANYLPYVIAGNLLFISGQVPLHNGKLMFTGKVGADLFVPEAQMAARQCALNVLAQVRKALDGELDRVVGIVKLGAFVNSTPDFTEHPQVVNGASDVMVEIFEDKGKHARFAVGVSSLPLNASVEVDAVVEFI